MTIPTEAELLELGKVVGRVCKKAYEGILRDAVAFMAIQRVTGSTDADMARWAFNRADAFMAERQSRRVEPEPSPNPASKYDA